MPVADPLIIARNRRNVLHRHHGPDHPATIKAEQDLEVAKIEAEAAALADHIAQVVESAPPLSPADADRLRALLPPVSPDGGGDAS